MISFESTLNTDHNGTSPSFIRPSQTKISATHLSHFPLLCILSELCGHLQTVVYKRLHYMSYMVSSKIYNLHTHQNSSEVISTSTAEKIEHSSQIRISDLGLDNGACLMPQTRLLRCVAGQRQGYQV